MIDCARMPLGAAHMRARIDGPLHALQPARFVRHHAQRWANEAGSGARLVRAEPNFCRWRTAAGLLALTGVDQRCSPLGKRIDRPTRRTVR
ncbi:hypothetical protein XAP3CFBP6996_004220 [Xanthomonas citri pv. fuscans CFBP 6996]|nr:hypothetical protein XcvCFBP7112P_04280 [Xanthomonas citri pv. vignicola]ASK99721.1 hypothetical protein XcvCFBP7113P_04320 [Xanthomonas citri pv. vignicola]PTY31225.1 hypothetical protein XAP3CFBP6996_004220 [Xanthomonas citri pv. fuscans CFBP 6996]QWN15160.1 hypothetical protein DGN02_04235 [Xanthomonas citri]